VYSSRADPIHVKAARKMHFIAHQLKLSRAASAAPASLATAYANGPAWQGAKSAGFNGHCCTKA
jgi:hypothetical protein